MCSSKASSLLPGFKIGYCTRMARPEDEIEALRTQVASLTARVYALERGSVAASPAQPQAIPAQPPAPPLSGTMLQPPATPIVSQPLPPATAALPQRPQPPRQPGNASASRAKREDTDLEKKIGQYWLNRIGIVAMLIGVSYFLKFAFDNNWVGPGGRITIGLLAGIGIG